MIISGGENVYAAEVEAVFNEHPAVAEAALIGKPDERWGEVGLMVVVLEKGHTTTADDTQNPFVESGSPAIKSQKRFIFTDALPYSSYGKVLKPELIKRYVEHVAEGS